MLFMFVVKRYKLTKLCGLMEEAYKYYAPRQFSLFSVTHLPLAVSLGTSFTQFFESVHRPPKLVEPIHCSHISKTLKSELKGLY